MCSELGKQGLTCGYLFGFKRAHNPKVAEHCLVRHVWCLACWAKLGGMRFTEDLDRWLKPAELIALSNAVDAIDDFLLGELADRYMTESAPGEGQFSMLYLPPRYGHLYDFRLLRRLYACLLVVAGRLQDGWEPPRCRGEELVMRAVLEHAEICFEELEGESTYAFLHLREFLFTDTDHEFMFDLKFDGIDDPETSEGAHLATGPLDPSAWFEPLYEDRPVHPMAD